MNWPSPVNSKTFSGGIMKTTQRQKLQPVFCPAYKMCSYKSSREIIEVTNQWLVHLETYTMRSSSPLTLPGGLGTRDRITQKPEIDQSGPGI